MYDIGTEVYGFKYGNVLRGYFRYIEDMDKFIGEIGTVANSDKLTTALVFQDGARTRRFSYPTNMIERHLVEKDSDIDLKQLLTQIKSL
jgi:hypothetical protein